MKGNDHKKHTYIDWFARRFYCQHARLNSIRSDKHKAVRDERHYNKKLLRWYDSDESDGTTSERD